MLGDARPESCLGGETLWNNNYLRISQLSMRVTRLVEDRGNLARRVEMLVETYGL